MDGTIEGPEQLSESRPIKAIRFSQSKQSDFEMCSQSALKLDA